MTSDQTPPAPPAPPAAPPPSAPPPFDPRRRLRELLSIPERDRTDPQWDEIVELEIQLAPGNRINPGQPDRHMPHQGRGNPGGGHGHGGGGNPGGGQQKKGGGKNLRRKPRPNKPTPSA